MGLFDFSKKPENTQNNTNSENNPTQNSINSDKKVVEDKKESMSWKCEQFFGRNWKYVAIFVGVTTLINTYETQSVVSEIELLKQVVAENNSKVVLTTSDGRAIKVTKEPLKAEYLKQFVVSTLTNNFLISRSQLTNNFNVASFKNTEEFFQYAPTLKNIYQNFIDNKDDKTRNIKANKIALGDLNAYILWLTSAVAQNKLPEYMLMKDYSINKYEYTQNKFNTEIVIKVAVQSFNIIENKYISAESDFKIYVEGSFDLAKSNDANPYGLRIERLKINPIVKA
ncbi:hypothetical protein CFVI03293_A0087 (plasmid) [Campylobacter fetus subsp. venerealis cfvi03/293]|nr:hypothetical protein [Campylobacter fetus]AHE95212.1 hypothetical protein CFVI03293_A0087 [Campylobacter fetus subsp. venerealis cfvi03/293]